MKPIVEVWCRVTLALPKRMYVAKRMPDERYLSRDAANDLIKSGYKVQPIDRVPDERLFNPLGIFAAGAAYTPVRITDQLPLIPSKWP